MPISAIGSHLVAHAHLGRLRVFRATYEQSPDDTVLVDGLEVAIHGEVQPLEAWSAGRYRLGASVVVRALPERVTVSSRVAWMLRYTEGERLIEHQLEACDAFVVSESGVQIVRLKAADAAAADESDAAWRDWLAATPKTKGNRDLVRRAWYVLGLNTVRLAPRPQFLAVVPSLFGYVGAWQWDAYFVAVALRHGLPDVARDQLRLVLEPVRLDGQLPDVVHDDGVLATSADLPPSDLDALAAAASPYLEAGEVVPLTKPPLGAWALAECSAVAPDPVFTRWAAAVLRRSQRWWYAWVERNGHASYHHPYSSGLDDSPVFDHASAVESPELAAFLLEAERELAGLGEPSSERDRAAVDLLGEQVEASYDPIRRLCRTLSADSRFPGVLRTETITGLLPLFWRDLTPSVGASLIDTLVDPLRFGINGGVPTVSRADPSYASDRMWRGPVWLNTNLLLVRALERQGRPELARELARASLAMVDDVGAFAEYYDSSTGWPAPRAVDCFAWTAAAVVDLAVWLSRPRAIG